VSRRTFLRRVAIGAGAAAVVTGTGVTWRILDQSILTPGTGDAYAAWRASLVGSGTLPLVRSAILAANAHDTQPWAFVVSSTRIDLFADRSRGLGSMDPLLREMEISLGCAIENLVLAAKVNALTPNVSLCPSPPSQTSWRVST
jgi:hypothetical protein